MGRTSYITEAITGSEYFSRLKRQIIFKGASRLMGATIQTDERIK